MNIIMTKTKLIKNPCTKTSYYIDDVIKKEISKKQYHKITSEDTLKWYRNLGGTEKVDYEYTSRGYKITKLISTSPNKKNKSIYEFDFK
tara:strand:+ start:82 stop:348 length:267 start_codon:yes stop_codon:yes gene_type:complete